MSAFQRTVLTVGIIVVAGCATANPMEKGSVPSDVPSVNPNFVVSDDKAQAGWAVWRDKACFVCHGNIGNGNNAGPDLFGLVERRDLDWIKRFLLETETMLEADPIANAMLEQYRFQRMPNMRLTEQQVENLTHYIQRQTTRKRAGAD
jgi:mono/diheme cytochrome c family protein